MAQALRKKSKKRASRSSETRSSRAFGTRSSRIDLRATREEERLIRLGAERRGENFTRFILKSACNEAEIALADQTRFNLPPDKFEQFVAALDRPAKGIPALRKLLFEPSVLEQQK